MSGQPDAVESYGHNAMGARSVNAGVAMDHQRPALSNGQPTDAAVPASWNGQPVVLDAGGRITSLGGATLAYNRRNQLVHVTGGTHEEYYDYDVWGLATWDGTRFRFQTDHFTPYDCNAPPRARGGGWIPAVRIAVG